jgi:SNF2 family DNA or RNA helicase
MGCEFHARLHVVQSSGRQHIRVRHVSGPYSDDMRARMYAAGSPATWNQAEMEWDYPLTPSLVSALNEVCDQTGSRIVWSEELAEFAEYHRQLDLYEEQVRLAIEQAIRDDQALPAYPTDMGEPPFRHQQIGHHWALRSSGLMLAWEPGLGKTRAGVDASGGWYREGLIRPMQQAWRPHLRISNRVWDKERRRSVDDGQPPRGAWGVVGGILVVAPRVVMRTWLEEAAKWQNLVAVEVSLPQKRADKVRRAGRLAHVHIINYESLPLIIEMENEYDALIVDESHKCANHSDQTMNVLHLAGKARRKLLLTGTPVSNSLESVFYQALICDGGKALGPSRTKFLQRYFDREPVERGVDKHTPRDGSVEAISKRLARCTYFLKKADVLDLPEQTDTPVYLEMTDEQRRYYDSLEKETITYIQDRTVTIEMAATKMMKLAQVCQGFVLTDGGEPRHFTHAKQKALTELLVTTYPAHKVVVWARFTHEIDLLCGFLAEAGINFIRFDGTVSNAKKNRLKHQWNHDPHVKVFVGQLQMGIGVTLHAAQCPECPCANTIYLGLDYSFVNWKQCRDRIHRIGQFWPCSYQYLLTSHGIDNRMYRALMSKKDTAEAVHQTGKDFYLSLLRNDIPQLAMIA